MGGGAVDEMCELYFQICLTFMKGTTDAHLEVTELAKNRLFFESWLIIHL